MAASGIRILLAAAGSAAAAAGVARAMESAVGLRSVFERTLVVGVALAVAGAVYLGLCVFLRVEELKPLLGWAARLTGRRGA